MFKSLSAVVLALAACGALAQTRFEGVGRPATPAEVKAWDIDVRADFKGLPPGRGTVAQGEKVWEAQCASCHGVFGESNEVFTPIVGGTTKQDMASGKVAALLPGANTPQRTTMMKLSSLSTLWDYINRAMPWTAPKTLSADEVYAVSAYILHLGDVLPADGELSQANMAAVQAKLPNRNGKTTAHAMWPVALKTDQLAGHAPRPDAQGSSCMRNCVVPASVSSRLPDYARNAHGNLAEQSRALGAMRGADTTRVGAAAAALPEPGKKPEAKAQPAVEPRAEAKPATSGMAALQPVLNQNACTACHALAAKGIGPSFSDIAKRYASRADGATYLEGKIKNGGQGAWGPIPMPAQALSEADAKRVAQWLMAGAAP